MRSGISLVPAKTKIPDLLLPYLFYIAQYHAGPFHPHPILAQSLTIEGLSAIIRGGSCAGVRRKPPPKVLFSPTEKDRWDRVKVGVGKLVGVIPDPILRQSEREIRRMADITELSSGNFEAEVLQSSQPVLVDFWAPWCGPCRMIGPVVEELAGENADVLKVAKINIDDAQDIAATYGVSSIPTLMIFKDGDVIDRFVGVQPKSRLQEAVDQAVE
jgi:thioredoxin 1